MTRWFVWFWIALGAGWIAGAAPFVPAAPWPAPNALEEAAVEEGQRLGIGSVELEGPGSVEVVSDQTWTLIYTAGKAGVRPGGSVLVGLRHLQSAVAGMPQSRDPQAPGYVTAQAEGGVAARVHAPAVVEGGVARFFPWQHLVRVVLPEGLEPGRTLRVTLGDRRAGSPGLRVQPFAEARYGFKVSVDAAADGRYLPLATTPTVAVTAGPPARIRVVMPSDAVAGRPTWCLVRLEDRFGNPADRYRGTVRLASTDPLAVLPADLTFEADDRGVKRVEPVVFHTLGVQTLTAEDGRFSAVGNPVRVASARPERLLLWGDLHGHTLFSDGRGTVEEYYDCAQRAVGLDFAAVSDHAFQLRDEMWEHSKRVTNRWNQPGRFVTFNAFEWSGPTPQGGDHNVYFLDDDPPLLRSTCMYDPRNLQMVHDQPKQAHVTEVFAELRRLGKDVFCIPHFGGRRGNPKWHDPAVQRLIEIFSEHRRSEDWAAEFLRAGHRVGIIASTDNHYGMPGYGYLRPRLDDWSEQEIGMAAVAVYSPALTREAVFRSLYDRAAYATSGDRIILDVRANGHLMGSELKAAAAPRITIEVAGTAPIDVLEIKKNGSVVHSWKPTGQTTARFEWLDPQFDPTEPCFYYLRLLQTNGEEAISSPIWVN